MKITIVAVIVSLAFCQAEDFKPIKMESLLHYRKVTITKVEPDGVRIMHESGMAKIPYEKLPPEIQKQIGFDEARALAHRTAQTAEDQKNEAALTKEVGRTLEKQAEDKKSLLGKTFAECIEKYGEPAAKGDASLVFQKAGIYIAVTFSGGSVVQLFYNTPKDEIGMSKDFTDSEFQTLMDMNSTGGGWDVTSKTVFYTTYATKDKRRVCFYDKKEHTITITTSEYAQLLDKVSAFTEEAKAKELRGEDQK